MDIKEPQKKKPKLTGGERHKRFVETAKKVQASDNPNEFDRVFGALNIKAIYELDPSSSRKSSKTNRS